MITLELGPDHGIEVLLAVGSRPVLPPAVRRRVEDSREELEVDVRLPKVGESFFWIAINGPSCALNARPLHWPIQLLPTPQFLIGFPTLAEAKEHQRSCLNDPASVVREKMESIADRDDIAFVATKDPDPPTTGPTFWAEMPAESGNWTDELTTY